MYIHQAFLRESIKAIGGSYKVVRGYNRSLEDIIGHQRKYMIHQSNVNKTRFIIYQSGHPFICSIHTFNDLIDNINITSRCGTIDKDLQKCYVSSLKFV